MIRFSKENRKRHFGGYFGRFTQKIQEQTKIHVFVNACRKSEKFKRRFFEKLGVEKLAELQALGPDKSCSGTILFVTLYGI